jgi:ribosomal protein L29
MDFKELKTKSLKDLKEMLASNQEKLHDLRFKDANKQLKDVREIRSTRQLIAQILTLINKQK